MTTWTALEPAAVSRLDVHVTGRRIVATMIDGLVLGAAYGLFAALTGDIDRQPEHLSWTATVPAAASVTYAVLAAAYFLVLETYRGQTLGKMAVGIRVVDAGTGGPPSFAAVLVRTLLRVVDGLASYLVAFVTVLLTRRRQRLGDRWGRTYVVREGAV